MEHIDETKRKPRRTKGTPSYHIRNRFAVVGILAGTAIFGLWSLTPIFRKANEKFCRELLPNSEEVIDRRFTYNLVGAPRTSRFIQETIDKAEQLSSER